MSLTFRTVQEDEIPRDGRGKYAGDAATLMKALRELQDGRAIAIECETPAERNRRYSWLRGQRWRALDLVLTGRGTTLYVSRRAAPPLRRVAGAE